MQVYVYSLHIRLFIFVTIIIATSWSVSANRRRRLLMRVGIRSDPPLKPFTNTSDIYVSYTKFLRAFVNSQGLFNRSAQIPSNSTYAIFMDSVVTDGTIWDRNELSAFMAHTFLISKGLQENIEKSINDIDNFTRNYNRRGYLGIKGPDQYRAASLHIFKDLRLLEIPELVLQNESINWKVSLWNWNQKAHSILFKNGKFGCATKMLIPKVCTEQSETIFKIYTLLKLEWDPESESFSKKSDCH